MTKDQDNSLNDLIATLRAGGEGLPPMDERHGMHGTDDEHGSHGMRGGAHDEPNVSTTVRTIHHEGHDISIETRYRITIDGQPFTGHVEVLDDGRVHYHGLPNYAPASMTALMRLVVDHFGTEPPDRDELAEGAPQ
jgi:hypothetical protein